MFRPQVLVCVALCSAACQRASPLSTLCRAAVVFTHVTFIPTWTATERPDLQDVLNRSYMQDLEWESDTGSGCVERGTVRSYGDLPESLGGATSAQLVPARHLLVIDKSQAAVGSWSKTGREVRVEFERPAGLVLILQASASGGRAGWSLTAHGRPLAQGKASIAEVVD